MDEETWNGWFKGVRGFLDGSRRTGGCGFWAREACGFRLGCIVGILHAVFEGGFSAKKL